MLRQDPLDAGQPHIKAWEEFRSSFSAVFQHVWLLDEIEEIAPGYLEALEMRFVEGFDSSAMLLEESPDHDGAVFLAGPVGRNVTIIDESIARLLYQQLFPHDRDDRSNRSSAYALAAVGLHAALEAYAAVLGIRVRGKTLAHCIARYTIEVGHGDLDAGTSDFLVECEATRHIVVHNRGVVDRRYIDRVKNNNLAEGELRPIDSGTVHKWASAIWRAGEHLHAAAASIDL